MGGLYEKFNRVSCWCCPLQGFKSFADNTIIDLDNNIAGIVGPNGSGKSNVVDAVRWVLGEQSNKQLRADNATSVIFSGSKSRKPLNSAKTLNINTFNLFEKVFFSTGNDICICL